MAMEYINYIKAKAHIKTATKSEVPVLSEEDEQFLNRIVAEENPPALPPRPRVLDLPVAGDTRGNDAQVALMDGAHNIPLPETPSEITDEPAVMDFDKSASQPATTKARSTWSWLRRDSRDSKRQKTAAGLSDIAQGLKHPVAGADRENLADDPELRKEEEDMTIVLERLNLAAVNNRVFSISDETQQLLQQFNQVFKDLVNGVPTAYHDLESLLTNGDRQLQKTFDSLPAFLQKLIEKLPETMTKGMAPEIMAAAAERAQKSGFNMQKAGKAAGVASKLGFKTPSLKDLTGKPAAVATMLRSIVAFLRARFPAFMGMNVLWSLALFVLLFVFWYCYKRGKEVRLEKERQLTEKEVAQLDKDYKATHPGDVPTTTAETGASMEDVRAGMEEVRLAKQAAAEAEAAKVPPAQYTGAGST